MKLKDMKLIKKINKKVVAAMVVAAIIISSVVGFVSYKKVSAKTNEVEETITIQAVKHLHIWLGIIEKMVITVSFLRKMMCEITATENERGLTQFVKPNVLITFIIKYSKEGHSRRHGIVPFKVEFDLGDISLIDFISGKMLIVGFNDDTAWLNIIIIIVEIESVDAVVIEFLSINSDMDIGIIVTSTFAAMLSAEEETS